MYNTYYIMSLILKKIEINQLIARYKSDIITKFVRPSNVCIFQNCVHIPFTYQYELSRVKLIIHKIIDRRPNKSAFTPVRFSGK